MSNIRTVMCAVAACATAASCAATPTSPHSADASARTFSNPLIEAFGGPIQLSSVEVRYPTDAFSTGLDEASARYVANHLSPDERQSFETFAAARGDTPGAMGERFSEYLAESDLRDRFAEAETGERTLRAVISVNHVHLRGMLASAMAPSFPTTDMGFTLYDDQTNAVFASGNIRRCASLSGNIDQARRKHGLHFNWTGTDTTFRMMAGMTNALASCVEGLLVVSNFPSGPRTAGTVHTGTPLFLSVPIRVLAPIYEISLGAEN